MAEAARGGNIEHGSAVLDMSPMAHPLSLVDPPYEIEHDSSCAGGSQNRDAEYVGDSAESTASHDCIRPSSNHRISFTVGPPSASSPPPSLSGDRAGITCPSHDRCLSSLSPERSSERCLSPLTPKNTQTIASHRCRQATVLAPTAYHQDVVAINCCLVIAPITVVHHQSAVPHR